MALVLVVDDFGPVTAAVSALITSMGHEGVAAHSGEEAIAFLGHRPADLVVLDLSMPGLSGLDVLRLLRADPALSSVAVVIFSMSQDGCDEAAALGVMACILKPNVDALSRELRRLLPQPAGPRQRGASVFPHQHPQT